MKNFIKKYATQIITALVLIIVTFGIWGLCKLWKGRG